MKSLIAKLNVKTRSCRSLAMTAVAVASLLSLSSPEVYAHGGGTTGGSPGFVTRASCASALGGGRIGTQMGNRNAQRLINAVWNRLGRNCAQLDRLATIISETPLAAPSSGGLMAACFYMGYTDTLWDQVEDIYNRCGVRCFSAGAEIGRISAEGYCFASIAVGGLDDPGFIQQPPLPFCGMNVSIGCKTEYVATATFDIPACHRYTVGLFENTFENSVRQDCFVPANVPIEDGAFNESVLF
ncbi:MAG: hypothetical protein IT285_05060 [Bdellovibrionales bacterium]|nr:hypothetical protein [Bdellovibrionales bacterium]